MTAFEGGRPSIMTYAVSLILPAALGCGSVPDEPESIAEQQSPIINGNSTSAGTATSVGVVQINHSPLSRGGGGGGGCTGQLLRNDLVITARHCVTTNSEPNGTVDTYGPDYTLFMDSQTATASEIIDATAGGTQFDFAYIIVTPFFQNSSNQAQGWSRSIYSGTDASLVGQTLNCYGYGANACPDLGFGTLRTASLPVLSSTSTSLTINNSSTQAPYYGDSGGTCFTSSGAMTLTITGPTNNPCLGPVFGAGPQVIAPNVSGHFWNAPGATIFTSTSSNVGGDSMVINSAAANGNSTAGVWITPNWNPPGQSANYLNHNVGVWFNGSQWEVFTEDQSTMATGESFNIAVGNNSPVLGATVSGDSMQIGFGGSSNLFIVTQNFNPSGDCGCTYNNHPIGIWYDGSQWWVYNEDLSAMPSGAGFNVHALDPNDGAYIHYTTSSNVEGDSTILNNPNLNGQPGAKVLVTHNWSPNGSGSYETYNNHPVGVWYTGSNWAIFNEDGAAMPTNAAFNVWIAP